MRAIGDTNKLFSAARQPVMCGKQMSVDDLAQIFKGTDCVVILDGTEYAAANVRAAPGADAQPPVIEVDTGDESILPHLTGAMLGPSTEFAEIVVKTSGEGGHTVHTNLTSYVQTSSRITLRLSVMRAERS